MHENNKPRNIVLVVLFVMITISSMFAISYAYYSSPTQILQPSSLDFQLYNTGCLSISTDWMIISTGPAYISPTMQETAIAANLTNHVSSTSTGKSIGILEAGINNNCNKEVFVDFTFVPTPLNSINLDDMRFGYCIATGYGHCASEGTITDSYFYETTGTAYCRSSTEDTAVTSFILGVTPDLAYDTYQKYCDITPFGIRIPANGAKIIGIRYWLSQYATNYANKDLVGRFLIYAMHPTGVLDAGTGNVIIKGDVNQDGYTDRLDAMELEQYATGMISSFSGGTNGMMVADANADGVVNINDSTFVYNRSPVRYGF